MRPAQGRPPAREHSSAALSSRRCHTGSPRACLGGRSANAGPGSGHGRQAHQRLTLDHAECRLNADVYTSLSVALGNPRAGTGTGHALTTLPGRAAQSQHELNSDPLRTAMNSSCVSSKPLWLANAAREGQGARCPLEAVQTCPRTRSGAGPAVGIQRLDTKAMSHHRKDRGPAHLRADQFGRLPEPRRSRRKLSELNAANTQQRGATRPDGDRHTGPDSASVDWKEGTEGSS